MGPSGLRTALSQMFYKPLEIKSCARAGLVEVVGWEGGFTFTLILLQPLVCCRTLEQY